MAAAEQLLLRYQNQVYGFLFTMLKTQHDAEDALQETYFSALRVLKNYTEQNQFKPWIFRIARNQAITIIRRRKRVTVQETPYNVPGTDETDNQPQPGEMMARQEQIDAFRAAMDQLPEQEREVVALRVQSEMPFKEIALIMDCSINTVLGRMHNAKQRLKQLMMEEQPV